MSATPLVLGAAEPLPELWRAWTQVLGLYASRTRRGRRPADGEYEALHHTLVALCDERAAGGVGSEFYRHLGEVARPWVSLRVLQTTDRELLAHLYTRCWELDRDLHGGHELRDGSPWWVVPVLIGIAALAVVGFGVTTGLFGWAVETIDTWGQLVRLWCARRTTTELVLIAMVVVLAVGGLLVWRTRRV